MNTPHRILLVEDELNMAHSIKEGLEEQGFQVEHAPDGIAGKFMATNKPFDLIILDVNLPHMDGYELCKHIRQHDAHVPILMLTAMDSIEHKIVGFDAGADDYISKPFDFRELLARIRVFIKRRQQTDTDDSEVLRVADLELHTGEKTVRRAGQLIELTAREFALLEFLMRKKGRVASRAEISEEVWDIDFDTGTNVVDVYINFLRKKIDKNFEPKLIHTKPGMGYFLKVLES
ncbi:MAG: DNA-binding response regulator [Saprospiraceae bacterium]|nr:MAG: DNA-binding response regulator [Saprospiraceae bacterium]